VNTHPFDQKELFREKFSEILLKTKAILYWNSWNFVLLSAILFWIRITLKKFAEVLSYVVFTKVRRHVRKKITKRRYVRKQVVFTLGLGLNTPYSLGISVSNFYQTFITVSIEFWLRFEPQIRPTWFEINFLFITARAKKRLFVCVWNCLIFFLGEYSSVWRKNCRVLSQIQSRFFCGISGKTISREFLWNFIEKKGYPLPQLFNFALLSVILFWVRIALKNSHMYFHMLFSPR